MRIQIIAILLLWITSVAAAQVQFSHPDRIRYDGQCVTIDGKDVFIFSGAFHYFRCPKELWPDRFAKIKAAGCNAVETYVAWNWHEREMPRDVNDFSKIDLADLRDWLKMAHEQFGLYTIIRPGPYICAEWAGGGFPVWLQLKQPRELKVLPWIRSDHPEYLAWGRHWFDAVCPVIAAEQIMHKKPGQGGVILVQIENEYDYFPGPTPQMRDNQLRALYQNATKTGIDVPIFTCWSHSTRRSDDPILKNIFDSLTTYPRFSIEQTAKQIDTLRREQTKAPAMAIELQGGWFSNVGGKLSFDQDGITAQQQSSLTMLSIAHGATILNYYMLFGGTNFGDWAARNITTTYDYAAALRESGEVGEKYRATAAIGQMLQELGPKLARSTLAGASDGPVKSITRKSADGDRFVFVWNPSRDKPQRGVLDSDEIHVDYDLKPFEMKMLYLRAAEHDASRGTWYPKMSVAPAMPPARSWKVDQFVRAGDLQPDDWIDLQPDASLATAGVFDSRYVVYRAAPTLSEDQLKRYTSLDLDILNDDAILARVNGHIVRPGDAQQHLNLEVAQWLRAGQNEIEILYENLGYANYGESINIPAGLKRGRLVPAHTRSIPLTSWHVQLLDDRDPLPLIAETLDDLNWPAFELDDKTERELERATQPGSEKSKNAAARILFQKSGASAVFRSVFDVPAETLKTSAAQLTFRRIDDEGTVYVNGKQVGQSASYEKPFRAEVSSALHAGRNVIAVVVKNDDGPGGITRTANLSFEQRDGLDLNWRVARRMTPTNVQADDPLMTSYEITFATPSTGRPIYLELDASGNGMLDLNGHPLGRYWQAGPQDRFYLPECWLRQGEANRVTLTARSVDAPVAVKSANIGEYDEESR